MRCGKWKSGPLSKSWKNCQGFTLLEVIIALGIVAIGILAVSRVITGFAETTITLEQRMLAGWVASNRLETLRILKSSPVPGTTHGSEEMADQVWYFRETTTVTADPHLFRVDITVFTDQEETEEAGSLYGYLLNQTALSPPTLTSGALSNSSFRRSLIKSSLRGACDEAISMSSINERDSRATHAMTAYKLFTNFLIRHTRSVYET